MTEAANRAPRGHGLRRVHADVAHPRCRAVQLHIDGGAVHYPDDSGALSTRRRDGGALGSGCVGVMEDSVLDGSLGNGLPVGSERSEGPLMPLQASTKRTIGRRLNTADNLALTTHQVSA